MIHFLPKFSNDAANTPFGAALRGIGVEHRIFNMFVRQHYRRRVELLLRFYPALARAAAAIACRSLLGRSGPPPDAVVVGSDVEVLVFALVRCWPGAAKAKLVFIPFIFTSRPSGVVNRLRLAYYRFVMRRVALAICHSEREIADNRRIFAGCGTQFIFVPWGTYVPQPADILAEVGPLPPGGGGAVVASAGKSGRDFATLVRAAAGLPCRVVIACNDEFALTGVRETAAVEVLRNCFGMDYLWQLLRADVVVVPLAVDAISAGQMVFIQAMALGSPLVVTDTPTVRNYLSDGETALLVPLGNPDAMRAAIRRLLEEPEFAAALATRAQAAYAAHFSGVAHLRFVVRVIEDHCAGAALPAA